MRPGETRLLLAITVVSAVGAGGIFTVAATLILGATRRASLLALAVTVGAISALVAWWIVSTLVRRVARPIDRILSAAERLQSSAPGEMPILGDSGHGLDQAALAFERAAAALVDERARLERKVEELVVANASLASVRESLVRSEKLATVGRLAAGLAHEVGNPLGAIYGYAELARARLDDSSDPALRDAVDRIRTAADRIDGTVRELLLFARPAPAEERPVAVSSSVGSALQLAAVHQRFRDVEVRTSIPDDLPAVLADERQLSQVLLNLFLNAGDAMRGSGRLDVVAGPDGAWIRIDVTDNGPGIAEEDLSRVFDPFFTTKDPGAGTGLGLSISHAIVESFGGTIAARNEPGGGATFTIRLRRAGAAGP